MPTSINEELGSLLRDARIAAKVTTAEAVTALNEQLGLPPGDEVTEAQWEAWEAGTGDLPDKTMVGYLAKLFGDDLWFEVRASGIPMRAAPGRRPPKGVFTADYRRGRKSNSKHRPDPTDDPDTATLERRRKDRERKKAARADRKASRTTDTGSPLPAAVAEAAARTAANNGGTLPTDHTPFTDPDPRLAAHPALEAWDTAGVMAITSTLLRSWETANGARPPGAAMTRELVTLLHEHNQLVARVAEHLPSEPAAS